MMKKFESEQIRVVAASVDPLEKAQETVEKLGLTFPMGYGLDAKEVSRITGAYYEKGPNYLHPTGFLLRPDNTVEVACYSSGPVGRMTAKDVLGLVRFYKKKRDGSKS